MRKAIFSKRGFSIIEVIISLLVLTVIGLAGWYTIDSMRSSDEVASNEVIATNVMQESMEEVRRLAVLDYDALSANLFGSSSPAPTNSPTSSPTVSPSSQPSVSPEPQPELGCTVFMPVSTPYPSTDMTRRICISNEGSTELKRVHITLRWFNNGLQNELDSVTFVARPPDPLYGNIVGVAFDSSNGQPITLVNISVSGDTGGYAGTVSFAYNASKNINYTMADPSTGYYRLKPGGYTLSASHPNYKSVYITECTDGFAIPEPQPSSTPSSSPTPSPTSSSSPTPSPTSSSSPTPSSTYSPSPQPSPTITSNFFKTFLTRIFGLGAQESYAQSSPSPTSTPGNIIVVSNKETRCDFMMEPYPQDGFVRVNLVNPNNPGAPPVFSSSSLVYLHKNGFKQQEKNTGGSTHIFTIKFFDTNEQCFTVATANSYLAGWYGDFTCNPERGRERYDFRGWSSSLPEEQVAAGHVTSGCQASWFGSSILDDVCVTPGSTTVVDAPLKYGIPSKILKGKVRDTNGNILVGATVTIDGANFPYTNKPASMTVTTDATGSYQIVVPAKQAYFFDNEERIVGEASYTATYTTCCNQPNTVSKSSGRLNLMNIYALSPPELTYDFVINITPPPNSNCGNADGTVKNDKTGAVVSGVNVALYGASNWKATSLTGAYKFSCSSASPPPYSLSVGTYPVVTQWVQNSAEFYEFSSTGNDIYTPRTTWSADGRVAVNTNLVTTVPLFGIWPVGYGNFEVVVVDQVTDAPVQNAKVELFGDGYLVDGVWYTDVLGKVTFTHMNETWPPALLPAGNPNYKYTPVRKYSFKVTHPNYINTHNEPAFTLDAGETKPAFVVELIKEGGP